MAGSWWRRERGGRQAQIDGKNQQIHRAVAVMEESWKEGRRHAVECDLKSFFDMVNRLPAPNDPRIHSL
jgi:hypothetical protein